MSTSPKMSINSTDLLNWLKNLLIFILPIALVNIDSIQTYILSITQLNPEVLGILLSALIKLAEYFLRANTPTVVAIPKTES